MNPFDIIRDVIKSKPILFLIVFFVEGCLLGWFIMGYVIWPVQYAGEAYSYELTKPEKEQYILMAADSYRLTGNALDAKARLTGWDDSQITKTIANLSTSLRNQGQIDEAQRVENLAVALNLSPETAPTAPGPGETPPSAQPSQGVRSAPFSIMSVIQICIGLILILIVIAAILFVIDLRRRKAKTTQPRPAMRPSMSGTPAPVVEIDKDALGHFSTKFVLGDDSYDESFSIETAAGEFLGECGVGISETIESGPPDKVTAFEIWLFDKSDISTITKVLMSEYAFNEPGIRDKLAPKGDAILAEADQSFSIETDAINMEVHILEIGYGSEGQHPNSYFETLSVELIARPRL